MQGNGEPSPSEQQGTRRATECSEGGRMKKGRFSAKRKLEAVLRLLRGEDLETVSRELGVTAAMLSGWRARVLLSSEAELKERSSRLLKNSIVGQLRPC